MCSSPCVVFFSCDRHPGHRVWRSGPLSNAACKDAPLNSSFSLSVCLSALFSCSLLTSVDSSSIHRLNNPNKYYPTEQESADWCLKSVSVSADIFFCFFCFFCFLKSTQSPRQKQKSGFAHSSSDGCRCVSVFKGEWSDEI